MKQTISELFGGAFSLQLVNNGQYRDHNKQVSGGIICNSNPQLELHQKQQLFIECVFTTTRPPGQPLKCLY